MSSGLRIACTVGFIFGLAVALSGQATLTVPSQFPTIQAALNAASSGDAIHVAAGTYTGAGNRDLDPLGKDVHILGLGGSAATVIDCLGSAGSLHRGFLITSGGPGLILEGLTVRNGWADHGGGLRIEGASILVRDVRVENCTANFEGGGVHIGPGFSAFGAPTFESCVFSGNSALQRGGGVYLAGNVIVEAIGATFSACGFDGNQSAVGGGGLCAVFFPRLSVADSSFQSNSATGYGFGAGIAVEHGTRAEISTTTFAANVGVRGAAAGVTADSSSQWTSCAFTDNQSTAGGSGMHLEDRFLGLPALATTVTGCTFERNASDTGGGGVRAFGPATDLTLAGCTFQENTSLPNGWGGALLAEFEAEVLILGCNFHANEAQRGAGIMNQQGADLVMIGGSLTENVSLENGGGIYIDGGATPGNTAALSDVLVSSNTASFGGAGVTATGPAVITMDGCAVSGNHSLGAWGGGAWLAFGVQATVTGTTFSNNTASRGGGMTIDQAANVSLSGVTIANNTVTDLGGGIYVNHGGNPLPATLIATDLDLVANVAPNGGGAFLFGPVMVSLTDSLIQGNQSGFEGGGMLALFGSELRLAKCVVTQNVASANGGALLVGSGSCAIVEECDFAANVSTGGTGGAISVAQLPASGDTLSARNCQIRGNQATMNNGGGVSVFDGARARFEGCMIVDNVAGDAGGVYADSVGSPTPTSVVMTSCTLVGNTSVGLANNLRLINANADLTNSLFRSTSPLQIQSLGASTVTANACNIQGGFAGAGNFDANPLFVDAPGGDYRLGPTSPCRNTGSNSFVPTALATDFEGTPRVVEGRVDVGADEILRDLPGTGEDLILLSAVDGIGASASTKTALPGSILDVAVRTPQGTFVGGVPVLVGNSFPASTPPAPSGIPGVRVNLASLIVFFDGSAPFPFGGVLSQAGVTAAYSIPGGLAGLVLRVQGAVISPAAANGLFATTDAHEIVFQ